MKNDFRECITQTKFVLLALSQMEAISACYIGEKDYFGNMSGLLFQNKYRIPSARLVGWDYGRAAMYFITVCTGKRVPYFGEIMNGKMCLSQIGMVAYNEWLNTPLLRADMNLNLGEFVVMPNHFHAILIIGDNSFNTPITGRDAMLASPINPDANIASVSDANIASVSDANIASSHSDANIASLPPDGNNGPLHLDANIAPVSDANIASLPPDGNNAPSHSDANIAPVRGYGNTFSPQEKNLGSVMRGFKSAVTSYAKHEALPFGWQTRFHDHIIRSYEDYLRISRYIANNIKNWKGDCFFE